MTSFRQIEANRRNAQVSTGPVTEEGKRRSRQNAVRHGLTAETVIDALEDAEDYAAFEMAVTTDYDAQSAVERELVLRLASLLWRLRRATAIESGQPNPAILLFGKLTCYDQRDRWSSSSLSIIWPVWLQPRLDETSNHVDATPVRNQIPERFKVIWKHLPRSFVKQAVAIPLIEGQELLQRRSTLLQHIR
jgi:hypothetical protein